ncbi:NAD(P)H-dependent oxidoreductase [Winogradskyella maritima]|uniref:NADPH-dependent FMN reductase n=1 Tax=Winogradskyella maritima TaxID=1517766 RepID=A0ABV8AL69_9FLAO|nr:NAD(P)H-dependent oxidoreductase [Winogradskyella maritima]
MKNIIAFAGSNSADSINKQLATYASSLVDGVEVDVLDLNDFETPMYSKQLEEAEGHPENAKKFFKKIKNSDGIVVSLAEYNGAYTSAFKNLFDWMSRIEVKTFCGKPMLLMATSPGARGGQSVLGIANSRFPIHDADIVAKYSLPSFNDNFKDGKIVNDELNEELEEQVEQFKNAL